MTARKLHLYGTLAERYGAVHEVACGTVSEAVRIVDCNHVGFCRDIRKMKFHIATGPSLDDCEEMPEHQLFIPRSTGGDWHLVPAIEGAKGKTGKIIFSIIVGGALLATGIGGAAFGAFGAAGSATAATATGFLGLSYGTVALMGAGIFLGGLNMLLMPTPQTDTSEKKPTSFSFDGPGEVDDEGGPIHIIIGEVITGGIRIASSVESTQSGTLGRFDFNGTGGNSGYFGGRESDLSMTNF